MSADASRQPLLRPQPHIDDARLGGSSRAVHEHEHADPDPDPDDEHSWKRFLTALGLGVLVWLLLCALVVSITDWPFSAFRPTLGRRNPVVDASYPPEVDGEIIACYPHLSGLDLHQTHSRWKDSALSGTKARTARATIDFLINTAEDITFIARGGAVEGTLVVEEVSGSSASARIEVEWDQHMTTSSPYLFQACELFHTGGGGRRLGLYMPWWTRKSPPGSTPARVVLTISMPQGRVKSLKSQTWYYKHDLRVSNRTSFSVVDINSQLGEIFGKISADSLALRSTNGHISGTYTALRRLSLHTSDAAINAHLVLGSRSATVPTFDIGTTNAPISGALRLVNSYSFDGVVRTTNADIDLTVAALPVNAKLTLNAKTSGAPARLALPATYEGLITQQAKDGALPELTFKIARDPLGLGRRYQVSNVALGRDNRTDSVSWGTTGGNGKVKLSTSGAVAGVDITTNWK